MEEINLQALENISTEVDESQIKIIFSSQCIKAQSFLIDKLKKQAKHQKEICNFISSDNTKLKAEIIFAEQEVKNLITALDTIKLGNIELRKVHLLKISEKLEIIERINTGEKKYEQLWLDSKGRFESIPYVQIYLQIKNRSFTVEENIKKLIDESGNLLREIQIKKDELQQQDQKIIIDLAIFMVKEQPQIIIDSIQKKIKEIKELKEEITILEKMGVKSTYPIPRKSIEFQQTEQIEQNTQKSSKTEKNLPSLSKNDNDLFVMPRLQLQNMDLDVLSVKLDQIRKVDLRTEQRNDTIMLDRFKDYNKENKIGGEDSSPYFKNMMNVDYGKKNKSYSEKKLIHIINDVTLKNHQALEIISKVDPIELSNVEVITSEITDKENPENKVNINNNITFTLNATLPKEKYICDRKNIAELLVSPTQFLDEKKSSQVKKVSFDISMPDFIETVNDPVNKNGVSNGTLNSIDDNLLSDECNSKKHDKKFIEDNLSSSQLIYNENSILHKMTQDTKIASKFFDAKLDNKSQSNDFGENISSEKINIKNQEGDPKTQDENINDCSVKLDTDILPTIHQNDEKELPVTHFLFNHGPQGISESLNLSESTQGFEDTDGEFARCIDSNILMSPKADITVEAVDDNVPISSQDFPSFMSGIRKSGLGFFGWSSSHSKEKSSVQNADSNFNFNFDGEEKKGRGGLFNMFR